MNMYAYTTLYVEMSINIDISMVTYKSICITKLIILSFIHLYNK